MVPKIILFELNEVPWRVLDDFVREHPLSELARLLERSSTYETVAGDTSLSPWITWPTVHRGVSDEEHTISDFGQELREINRAYPPVWEILRTAGVPTGVFGSLHTHPLPERNADYAFFVPDVFAAGAECVPESVRPFQEFNLAMSRRSARNVSTSVPAREAAAFLANARSLGIRLRTALDVGRQLVDERLRPWTKARRRTYQVVLAFDVFLKELERTRPSFCTFFTNHVASSMHRYWAARYPGDYAQFSYDDTWVSTYRNEIRWTISVADAMVGELVRFVEANPGYELWIATSMGQAATEATEIRTQVYLRDIARFMAALGFDPADWQTRPAMLPRIVVALTPDKADEFARKAGGVTLSDRGALPVRHLGHGVFRIHPGVLHDVRDETCNLGSRQMTFAEMGFENAVVEDAAGQSAYHVPSGVLAIHAPHRRSVDARRTSISTIDVAPMILERFGVSRPAYMRGDPRSSRAVSSGRS